MLAASPHPTIQCDSATRTVCLLAVHGDETKRPCPTVKTAPTRPGVANREIRVRLKCAPAHSILTAYRIAQNQAYYPGTVHSS
jgi:hypothetical protein